MSDVERMKTLAEKWHEGQFRRGPEERPFIEHPLAVEKQLREWGFTESNNPYVLTLALGHDLYKQGDVDDLTFADILGELGFAFSLQLSHAIISLSYECGNEVSSFEEYDKARAAHLRKLALCAPIDVLLVKIADRIVTTKEFLDERRGKAALQYYIRGKVLFRRISSLPNSSAIRDGVVELERRLK